MNYWNLEEEEDEESLDEVKNDGLDTVLSLIMDTSLKLD